VSEYVVEGDMWILEDNVILLHRVLTFPPDSQKHPRKPIETLPRLDQMIPLDNTGSYSLQTSIKVQDANPDMVKGASQRLLRLKDLLRSAVKLEPADRLALDTRVRGA
jgi:hypothetical protein